MGTWTFSDNRDRLLLDMEGVNASHVGGAFQVWKVQEISAKRWAGPSPSQRMDQNKVAPIYPSSYPPPSPSLLSCTRMVVSHPRAQPMARELGPDSQLNGGSGTEMAPPPKGRRPLATREAGLSAVFAARRAQPSSADSLPP